MDAPAARIAAFFEAFETSDLDRLESVYLPDAQFKDPFNTVRGVDAIRAVYAHMFETLEQPRFKIVDSAVQGPHCFLTWEFHLCRRGSRESLRVRGASHLRLAGDGRIAEHRDYWDAAEELYEQLPGIGVLMRWLRRRIAAPQPLSR